MKKNVYKDANRIVVGSATLCVALSQVTAAQAGSRCQVLSDYSLGHLQPTNMATTSSSPWLRSLDINSSDAWQRSYRKSKAQSSQSIGRKECDVASVWVATPTTRGLDVEVQLLDPRGEVLDRQFIELNPGDGVERFDFTEGWGWQKDAVVKVIATSKADETAEFFWSAKCRSTEEMARDDEEDIPEPRHVRDTSRDTSRDKKIHKDYVHMLCIKDTGPDGGDVMIPPNWIKAIAELYDMEVTFDLLFDQGVVLPVPELPLPKVPDFWSNLGQLYLPPVKGFTPLFPLNPSNPFTDLSRTSIGRDWRSLPRYR